MVRKRKTEKKVIPAGPVCPICGGRGYVFRAYVEPEVAANYALDRRPCPKCITNPPQRELYVVSKV